MVHFEIIFLYIRLSPNSCSCEPKPKGQGTGLGLSLSYDIIKAHGGELKVETKEGHWAAFIIQLALRDIV